MQIQRPQQSAFALIVGFALTACSTLSNQVRSSAVEFSDVMEEFSNQVLVTNLLRAQDQSPLNFANLPTISGAIGLKASSTLTLPFGARYGSGADVRKSAGPLIEFSSNPTFDTTSLNTQSFTLSMIQPVSPVYIESIWNSGVPKELLLYLFVESIQPPGAVEPIRNDPDEKNYKVFKDLVSKLIDTHAQLRSFTVLERTGIPYAVQEAASAPGQKGASAPAPDPFANVSADKYLPLIQLDPNNFRTALVTKDGRSALQVYRRYPSQIAFCVDPVAFPTSTFAGSADPLKVGQTLLKANNPSLFTLLTGPMVGRRPAVIESASALKGAPSANGASVLLDQHECNGLEKFAAPQSQEEIEGKQDLLGFVRWRSTADVFRFLGSVLRKNRQQDPVQWFDGDKHEHRLIEIVDTRAFQATRAARITVKYQGSLYAVAPLTEPADSPPGRFDHSLEVLSLLSRLVNAAKHSEDIPTPRTLQVLP